MMSGHREGRVLKQAWRSKRLVDKPNGNLVEEGAFSPDESKVSQ